MNSITAKPIWLPLLFESDQPAITLLGGRPLFQLGAECRFFISIFESFGQRNAEEPGALFDVGNFAAFICKIRTGSYGSSGTLKLDTSDVAAIAAGAVPAYNYNATAEQFWAREAAQIQLYIPASLTANLTAGDLYAVFSGATAENAAQPDCFGKAICEAEDVGLTTVASPPAPTSDFVRNDIFAAAFGTCVKFGVNLRGRYPIIVNEDGTYGTATRTGSNGEWIEEQLANP